MNRSELTIGMPVQVIPWCKGDDGLNRQGIPYPDFDKAQIVYVQEVDDKNTVGVSREHYFTSQNDIFGILYEVIYPVNFTKDDYDKLHGLNLDTSKTIEDDIDEPVEKEELLQKADRRGQANLAFGVAIEELKSGAIIARASWVYQDIWIYLKETNNVKHVQGRQYKVANYIVMKTADGILQAGWTPTQQDMLANDWCIIA